MGVLTAQVESAMTETSLQVVAEQTFPEVDRDTILDWKKLLAAESFADFA